MSVVSEAIMNVLHFNSQKERLDFLKGGFKEIIPQEVIPQEVKENASESVTELSEVTSEKKPKKAKKGKKNDKVQAE